MDKFDFYASLKGEDAFPYTGKNLLVACDGLGGSGSSKHNFKIENYEEIRDLIFTKEEDSSAYEEYGKKLFEKLISEEEKVILTSAYVASRVVILKYVYLMEKVVGNKPINDDVKKTILDGINASLSNVCDKFKLEKTPNTILLPTTLVSIRYQDDSVDVIWAGDSRAYYLDKTGLHQLSEDNEENERITNIFGIDETTQIYHKNISIAKPSCLFVCSDGVFDVFNDKLPLEQLILSSLNEANGFDELSKKLFDYYEGNDCEEGHKQDDVTMSFVSFYDDYKELKKEMKDRIKDIGNLFNDYKEYYIAMEEDVLDSYKDYLRQRTITVQKKIMKKIYDEKSNKDVKETFSELMTIIDNNYNIALEAYRKRVDDIHQEQLHDIRESLKNEKIIKDIPTKIEYKSNDKSDNVKKLFEDAQKYVKLVTDLDNNEKKLKENTIEAVKKKINDGKVNCAKIIYDILIEDKCKYKGIGYLLKVHKVLSSIDNNAVKKPSKLRSINNMFGDKVITPDRLEKIAEEYGDALENDSKKNSEIENLKTDIEKVLSDIAASIDKLSIEEIKKYGFGKLDANVQSLIEKYDEKIEFEFDDSKELANVSINNNEQAIEQIILALKKETIIDDLYNKLQLCGYRKICAIDANGLAKFKEEYAKYIK